MTKQFLLSLLALFLGFCSASPQVKVEAKLDSMAILIGEQVGYTISATAPKGSKVKLPEYKAESFLTQGVEIVEVEDKDTVFDGDNFTLARKLTLTSFDEYGYAIPEQTVVVDNNEYTTNELALKVITVDVDTLNIDQFFQVSDIQDNPFLWAEWLPLIYMFVGILLLVALSLFLYKRLKNNKPLIARIKTIRHIPAHQKALTAIEAIKQDHITATEDSKEYYTRLTDALRLYIEERFGFSAKEMTTHEIIDNLMRQGSPALITELRELFETADLVKFAKHSTQMNENDVNLVNAIQFIDQTKTEDTERLEHVLPTLSEQEKQKRLNHTVIVILMILIGLATIGILSFIGYRLFVLLS